MDPSAVNQNITVDGKFFTIVIIIWLIESCGPLNKTLIPLSHTRTKANGRRLILSYFPIQAPLHGLMEHIMRRTSRTRHSPSISKVSKQYVRTRLFYTERNRTHTLYIWSGRPCLRLVWDLSRRRQQCLFRPCGSKCIWLSPLQYHEPSICQSYA